MTKNTETLLTEMMANVSKYLRVKQDELRNNVDPSTPPKISWVVSYGEGEIVFQYIDEFKVNVNFYDFNNEQHPIEFFAFYENNLEAIDEHLTTIQTYMEELYYQCCPHDRLLDAVMEYGKKYRV